MAKKDLKKGLFITLEGIEGCGKSTQVSLLCGYLSKCGYAYVHTREPGGTKLGECVRNTLLHSDAKISDLAELFLFEACRAEIVGEVIKPALKAKKIVVCDRFSDATLAYQGYGGKVPLKVIGELDKIATGGLRPDLTIVFDIDIKTGLRRARKKGIDRMEAKDLAYHKRVRAGYLALARKFPKRIKVVRVSDNDIAAVQTLVRREVERVIRRY